MLETFEVSKVLIIAPLRVARDTWPAEIEKWDHLQGLDISVIVRTVPVPFRLHEDILGQQHFAGRRAKANTF